MSSVIGETAPERAAPPGVPPAMDKENGTSIPGAVATNAGLAQAAGDTAVSRRNYVLGVGNGVLFQMGLACIHPSLVLAAFVLHRTDSNLLVGLLVTLTSAGFMWPQLYLSSMMEHRPRRRPFYIFATVSRITLLIALTGIVFVSGAVEGAWILALFFVLYFLYQSAQGCSLPPFMDIIGQTVAPTRRGGFFAHRNLLGGAMGLLVGLLLVHPIQNYVGAPLSYGWLFALGTLFSGAGWIMFSFVREQQDYKPPEPRRLREIIASGVAMLGRDRNYRGLLTLRALFRVATLALVFYVSYGERFLGVKDLSGLLVGCVGISGMASSLVWGRLSNRHGNRVCLVWAGVFYVLSPWALLMAPSLPDLYSVPIPLTSVVLSFPLTVYLLSLCLFGLAQSASMIGISAFTLETAPAHRRPSYMAFLNTALFPVTFLPLLAGAVVGNHDTRMQILFGLIMLAGACYIMAAVFLTEVRHRTLAAMREQAAAADMAAQEEGTGD